MPHALCPMPEAYLIFLRLGYIKFCYHKLSKQLLKKVKFMAQTIQARNVALNDLETQFKIEWIEDDQFFREWQDDLPEITDAEKQRLDRVKASYRNLLKHPPLLENTVKMVVLRSVECLLRGF
ncbi:MAG: DUF2959 domain-containing protein [Microcoleus sp. CAN_BIN18]|nr:DUF2959 domain-containing protein [Microcoleus sp. CAN_BIN18]